MSIGPVLMVGCGGSGIMSVRHAREAVRMRLAEHNILEMPKAWQFLGFDVQKAQSSLSEVPALPKANYEQVRGEHRQLFTLYQSLWNSNPPKEEKSGYRELLGWLPHHIDVPGNLELGCGQMRAVGRAVGVYGLRTSTVEDRIRVAFSAMQEGSNALIDLAPRLEIPVDDGEIAATLVIVVGSSGGGTGAGLMLDVVDWIRRNATEAITPLAVVYEPEIFGDNVEPWMVANSVAFMSEMMNAYWATDGGAVGLFPAPHTHTAALDRGPYAIMSVGRRGMTGADLDNSTTVYKAIGDAMSSWILSPTVNEEVQNYVQGNRVAKARVGGYMFGGAAVRGGLTSFGSSTIGVGRSRFRRYAKAFLMRDMYEFHYDGYRPLAIKLQGEEYASRNGELLVKDLASSHFLDDFVDVCGLKQEFNPDGRVGDGFISSILSLEHTATTRRSFEQSLLAGLSTAAESAATWRESIATKGRLLRDEHLKTAKDEREARTEEWLKQLAERVLVSANELAAKATLPVAIAVLDYTISKVRAYPAKFRAAAVTAEKISAQAGLELMSAFVFGGSVRRDAPEITTAIGHAGVNLGQAARQDTMVAVARVMDIVERNILRPIQSAMSASYNGDVKKANTDQARERSLVSAWPKGNEVPRSFQPSKVEFLLESWDVWPSNLEDLLQRSVIRQRGESSLEAFRREVMVGHSDALGERPPMLRLKGGSIEAWSPTHPLDVVFNVDPASLDHAVSQWISESTVFSNHVNEGLQSYLADAGNTERLDAFKEKLRLALQQCQPLMRVNQRAIESVLKAEGGTGEQVDVEAVIDELPFPNGHPARVKAEEVFHEENMVTGYTDIGTFFCDHDKESCVMSTFLNNSIHPAFSITFTEPFARHYSNNSRDAVALRDLFAFKRSRTLSEFVPLPKNLYRAMIRGFLVARILGKMNVDVANGVRILEFDETAREEVERRFPHPLLSPVQSPDCLPALLESLPLAYAKFGSEQAEAFAAYRALFRFGVPDNANVGPNDFVVCNELERFLRNGFKPGSRVLDDRYATELGSLDKSFIDRCDSVIEHVEARIDQLKMLWDELSPSGKEMRRISGTIEFPRALPAKTSPMGLLTLEIYDDLVAQYQVVMDAVTNFRDGHGEERPTGSEEGVRPRFD